MAGSNNLTIDVWSDDTTNGPINVSVFDTSNAAAGSSCSQVAFTPASASTWEAKAVSTCLDSGTFAANGVITVQIKMTAAATTGNTRIGRIFFDYSAKF